MFGGYCIRACRHFLSFNSRNCEVKDISNMYIYLHIIGIVALRWIICNVAYWSYCSTRLFVLSSPKRVNDVVIFIQISQWHVTILKILYKAGRYSFVQVKEKRYFSDKRYSVSRTKTCYAYFPKCKSLSLKIRFNSEQVMDAGSQTKSPKEQWFPSYIVYCLSNSIIL